jgi:hypothetical protein
MKDSLSGREGTTPPAAVNPTDQELSSPLTELVALIQHNDAVERNLREVLNLHGIHFPDLRDLVAKIWTSQGEDELLGIDGVQAVGRLVFLHGFTEAQVALMAGVDTWVVSDAVKRSPRSRAQGEVLRAHLAGMTPQEIENELGIKRQMVYRWLEEAGHRPNTKRSRTVPELTQTSAVKLYRAGESIAGICVQLDLDEVQVETILRRAANAGELPGYGERWAV